jgi:hypothetical protein
MIESILIISKTGILRFIKIYSKNDKSLNKTELINNILINIQKSENTQIIYDFPYINNEKRKLVYKSFGGIYLVLIIDECENELASLDFINVIMKVFDEIFKGVCEIHMIVNPDKLYFIIDEMICGGIVIETNKEDIIKNYNDKIKLDDNNYKYFSN